MPYCGRTEGRARHVAVLRGYDLDGETERAWESFGARLADDIAQVPVGASVSLTVTAAERAEGDLVARVTVTGIDGQKVRCDQWLASGADVPSRVVQRRKADVLAADIVRRLRDRLDVLHPSFLEVGGDERLAAAFRSDGDAPHQVRAEHPTSASHLRTMVQEVLTDDLAGAVELLPDGDIVVDVAGYTIHLRSLNEVPAVRVFARLVREVTLPFEARAVVDRLNRDYPTVKFLFERGSVIASVHLPADPFVPAQLHHVVACFAEQVVPLADDLVARLGGQHDSPLSSAAPHNGGLSGLPPELLELLEADPEGLGLDAETTARVCGYDRATVRQLLHVAERQEESWRSVATGNARDSVELARRAGEALAWGATRQSLVRALDLLEDDRD